VKVVYWIHLKEHTDITKDGYVGVATNFQYRMLRHSNKTIKLDSHFSKAIKKYGWDCLVKEIVFEGTSEECFAKEKELRPKFQIGWNEAIGGLGGDRSAFIDYKKRKNKGWNYDKTGSKNPFYGKTHSKEFVDYIKEKSSKYIVYTPDGRFLGFRSVARFYNISKTTAKKWAENKPDWRYENK
jgi:hypothetical protein